MPLVCESLFGVLVVISSLCAMIVMRLHISLILDSRCELSRIVMLRSCSVSSSLCTVCWLVGLSVLVGSLSSSSCGESIIVCVILSCCCMFFDIVLMWWCVISLSLISSSSLLCLDVLFVESVSCWCRFSSLFVLS